MVVATRGLAFGGFIDGWMDGLGTSLSACLMSVSLSLVLSLSVSVDGSLSLSLYVALRSIHTHSSLIHVCLLLSACLRAYHTPIWLAFIRTYTGLYVCVCIGAAALLSSRSSSFVVKGVTACLPARPPITECKSGGRERANELRHTDRSVGRSGLT